MTFSSEFSILRRLADEPHVSPSLTEFPPFPKNMMVELSNACNHACIFCANPKMTRRIGRIDPDLLERLLGEARTLGVNEVGFYTTGDPFVHKDLAKFVALAKSLGIRYTYVSTNGALAVPARLKAVIDAGLDSMKFSINAGSRATYRAIHGKDEYDRVIENLMWISNYRNALTRPLYLSITFVVINQNQHEVEGFRERLAPFVDDIYFSPGGIQAGNMLENLQVLLPDDHVVPDFKPCWMLFGRAHITCEGYLTLCCVDYQNYLALVDLKTTTLENGWRHARFAEMRRRHLDNELEGTLCYNCLYGKLTPIQPLVPEFATIVDWDHLNDHNKHELQNRLGIDSPK